MKAWQPFLGSTQGLSELHMVKGNEQETWCYRLLGHQAQEGKIHRHLMDIYKCLIFSSKLIKIQRLNDRNSGESHHKVFSIENYVIENAIQILSSPWTWELWSIPGDTNFLYWTTMLRQLRGCWAVNKLATICMEYSS